MSVKDKKAVQFTATQIKLEGQDGQETITDIQNYLDSFNKEIQGGEGTVQQLPDVQQIVSTGDSAPEGTYFMDHAGHYYYQSATGDPPVMTMVSGLPPGGQPETTFVTMPATDTVAGNTVSTIENVQDNSNRVILNTGDYQTVTIVPSDTNPGEVSYVLIVQQPEDEKEDEEKPDDQDLTVYDFDDAEENPIGVESGEEDDKTKIIKIIPRKSQSVTQPHMCNYCNYTSPKRYLLSRHMKSHSEERPHKCSVCERGFKTLASLQNHVNTHTGTKPHGCKYCESAFTTSGELVRHVRYRHTYEKPHRCTDCDYTSVEMSKLRRHARCHSGERPYQVRILFAGELVRHVRYVHTHEKPHQCKLCDYASVEPSKLRNHMRLHTGERPYQCPHCTYASQDTFKLKRHLRTHTGEKPYECDICHMRFTQSNSLKAHKLIHSTADKPVYHCELCPATCGRKTDLRIHVQKLHTSEKPLKCKRCGKSFPDRYTYKIHNKTHEGEKCYKCDLCPYASISARHLESHMLIHTDQKPYRCDHCDQSFRQKQLLKRHQNLYHNPQYVPPSPREKTHRCPECNRNFRHKGNLIRHMAVHDPDASAQEKAVALKLGRQKKIQIIDGQQVTVMPGDQDTEDMEDEDDDLDDSNVMAVEGTDGQQYVVLEVIQLQDGDGQEQALAVVAGDNGMSHHQVTGVPGNDTDQDENIVNNIADDAEVIQDFKRIRKIEKEDVALRKTIETQKDMQNCFGFDEEDEEDIEEEEEETKIHLL